MYKYRNILLEVCFICVF